MNTAVLSRVRSSLRGLICVAALLSILAAGRSAQAAAGPVPDLSLYRAHAALDVGISLSGAALWVGAFAVVSTLTPNRLCDPCNRDEVNAIDRPFIGFHNPAWRPVGHSLYALPMMLFVVLDMRDVGFRRWKIWLTDALIIMEAMVLQGAVTEIWRRSIQRPRPFLYEPGVYPDDRRNSEATYSFYSGHVSSVFSLVTGIAYTWTLRHTRSRFVPLVWVSVMLAASLAPIARVASGDHFPTDVFVGAVVGTGFGLAWPALRHYMHQRDKKSDRLSLLTSIQDGGLRVSLGGRF
jgi:membrane-associated phospholipid phosphatase